MELTKYNPLKAEVIRWVAIHCCVSEQWVRRCVKSKHIYGEKADYIRKCYTWKLEQLENALKVEPPKYWISN